MTEIYIVEIRSIKVAKTTEQYLACEPVFFASTVERAESWMLDQNPGNERYYYCLMKTLVDSDHDFELIGYYDTLGQKTTQDRCLQIVLNQKPAV